MKKNQNKLIIVISSPSGAGKTSVCKKLIEKDIQKLENRFNKKVVTYIRSFEKFYRAEEYHQDFYKIKLERYLRYKKACGREEILKRILGSIVFNGK